MRDDLSQRAPRPSVAQPITRSLVRAVTPIIAAGCDPANGPYSGAQMDAIVEVDLAGKVVWEWWFFDHAVQDIDPTKASPKASTA